jgi:hypothetical protein
VDGRGRRASRPVERRTEEGDRAVNPKQERALEPSSDGGCSACSRQCPEGGAKVRRVPQRMLTLAKWRSSSMKTPRSHR